MYNITSIEDLRALGQRAQQEQNHKTIHQEGKSYTVSQLIAVLQTMPQDALVILGQLDKPKGKIIGGSELVAIHTEGGGDVWLMPDGD